MIKINSLQNSIRNKKNRSLIFCTSFLSMPFTISLIEHYKNQSVVLTHSNFIFKFLKKNYPYLDIVLIHDSKSILNKNFIKIFKNNYFNYLLKNETKSFLNEYSNCKVFTTIQAFSHLTGYSLTILSKKNTIYHKKLVKLFWEKSNFNLKLFFNQLYLRLFYGLHLDQTKENSGRSFLSYSNFFFKSIKVKKTNLEINSKQIKKFLLKNYNYKNKKILLLSSQRSLETNIIDKSLLKKLNIKLLKYKNLKQFIFKRRDNSEKKNFLEKILLEADPFCPSNLYIYKFKIVIGYHSASLFEAANAGCKAISLLDLLGKNDSLKFFYKKYFRRNLNKDKKIFYPKTFKQFFEILDN